METKSWKKIKDDVYGVKGTERRDELDRNFESFKIGLLLRQTRESKKMTQLQLAQKVDKKREYISRIYENVVGRADIVGAGRTIQDGKHESFHL